MKTTLLIMLMILSGCSLFKTEKTPEEHKLDVAKTLDLFHHSAAIADGKNYFRLFSNDGVFLGTDASERWTVEDFKEYATPYFEKGKGWFYLSKERHILLSPDNKTAWFDELLDNQSYGTCRGSGILFRNEKGEWEIAQYHLTIPMPNDLTKDFVKQIRSYNKIQEMKN